MFIKITKSYEVSDNKKVTNFKIMHVTGFTHLLTQILSNEDKRSNFDRYGQTDNTHPYGGGHNGYQDDSFYFEESFFNFPFNSHSQQDFANNKYILHFNQYVNEVVPDSFKRPYLIKITSDWCFSCIHIEPVWKEVVQEMEDLGLEAGGDKWSQSGTAAAIG